METITQTGSVTLVPNAYVEGSGMTATNTDRGLNASSNTTYAQFAPPNGSLGYCYYTFDTSSIPSTATSITVSCNVKTRVSNSSGITTANIQLYSSTTAKGSAYSFPTTTSTNVTALTTGTSWTRNDLNDLKLRIEGQKSTTSNRYLRFYGADITISYTYTLTTYDVTVTNSTNATVTASDTAPIAGDDVLIVTDTLSGITIKDNNTDVTSQFVQLTSSSDTYTPISNTNSNFTLSNIDNAYAGSDSGTYAQLTVAGSTTGTIYFNFPSIDLPSGATVQSIACAVTLQFNANNSTSGFTSSCQLYSGSTAKGSATNWVTSGSNVAKTTYNLTTGTWSNSDLSSVRVYITATNSARQTQRYVYMYGATLTVTYEISGTLYVYTISNISADHTIVVANAGSSGDIMYLKVNGGWVSCSKVYKKVSGSWVEQSNLTNVFDSNTIYIKK